MERCGSLGNEDMISDLPDALLLEILSLIPTKDAVSTCVLSKRWRSVYKMMPNLRFYYCETDDPKSFSDNFCKFLQSHEAPFLQSLHLEMDFEDDDSDMDIELLLGIAYGLHVRELKLEAYSHLLFRVPTSVYNCGTLETLKLDSDVLVDVTSPVCLKSLRTLHLHGVTYQDDESVVNLLSGCSGLVNLEVTRFSDSDVETFTIDVPSLQSLTLISINKKYEGFADYYINAPRLKYLSLQGLTEDDYYLIESMPELVEAHINVCYEAYENILGALTSVKLLSLTISSPLDLTKFPTDGIFNQLVCLEMHTYEPEWWNLCLLMLHSSPNLQVLKLIGHWCRRRDMGWSQPEYVPECLVNRLETLVWKDYEGEVEDEKELAQYILRNASRLETATFSKLDIHPEKRVEWLKELESAVMASNSCRLVFK